MSWGLLRVTNALGSRVIRVNRSPNRDSRMVRCERQRTALIIHSSARACATGMVRVSVLDG